ncbi:hypothetical protein [Hymenobacter sp. B81]|uniref:hypothetical protein n=1 Tax=Hymenobacter sp. B81 TaxID=3344878 RepID=UPI0037DCF56C
MLNFLKPRLLLGLLSVALAVSGCKLFGGNEPAPEPEEHYEPGFGPSQERPVGTAFTWPAGITLIGEPADDNLDCVMEADQHRRNLGNGGMVSLCLNLYNSTSQPINVTLPPGLMWIAKSLKTQNGIIVNRISFEVPPGQRFFRLHTYCANGGTRSPSGGQTYEAQPLVTQHPGLQELIGQLETRKINFEDYGGERLSTVAAYSGPVAGAVTKVAFNEPISEQTRRELAALPLR